MSTYLQRLFSRAAAPVAAPALSAAAPATRIASPVAERDQRLALPEFSAAVMSPDAWPEGIDDGATPETGFAPPRMPPARDIRETRVVELFRRDPAPARETAPPPAARTAEPATAPAVAERDFALPRHAAEPVPSPAAESLAPREMFHDADVPAAAPAPQPPAPMPRQRGETERPAERPELRRAERPAEPSLRQRPDLPGTVEPAPAPRPAEEIRPFVLPEPAVSLPATEPAPRPVTTAEPAARRVETTVEVERPPAETAREPAAQPAVSPAPRAAENAAANSAPKPAAPSAPRPLTAEAASVIGPLPIRRRTLSIFGMRRR